MKKSFNLLLAFLMSLFVFSCSDITNTKLEEKASSSKVTVSFSIKGNDSRTALPVFDFASYKITAKNLSTDEEETVYTGENLASPISMEVGTYDFTLIATTSGNSVYEGNAKNVEIKEKDNSIIFSLALKESSEEYEYGSISVDLVVAESLIGEDISVTADILDTNFESVYEKIELTNSNNTFTCSIPRIEAGNYFVKFSISKTGYASTTRYIAVQVWKGLHSVGSVMLNALNEAIEIETVSDLTSAPTSGTYYITNADDLRKISDWSNNDHETFSDVTFILKNDISITDDNWTPIGPHQDPTSSDEAVKTLSTSTFAFAGTFDGNGHSLTLPAKKTEFNHYRYTQLMYYNNGTVKNLKMKATQSPYVLENNETECNYGSVCAYNNGNVLNCENYVSITGGYISSVDEGCGGIVSRNNLGAVVKNCANYADFSGNYTEHSWINSSGGYRVYGATGGIAGNNFGTIENCVNYGKIAISYTLNSSRVATIGAIVGTNREDSILKNCYWLKDCIDNPRSIDSSNTLMKNEGVGSYCENFTNILGNGSFESSTITGGLSVYKRNDSTTFSTLNQTLDYGNDLVTALNNYVSETDSSQLKSWKMIDGKVYLDF